MSAGQPPHTVDQMQLDLMAQRIADQAIARFDAKHPVREKEAEIPSQWKWVGGIITALVSAGVIGVCFWVVSTLSDLQQTVVRMDERQLQQGDGSFAEIQSQQLRQDQRLDQLESYHRQGSSK